MLLYSVVVNEHDAAANVAVLADIAVAHICQMRDLGAVVDRGIFDFNKITDAAVFADALAGNSMVFAVAWLLASG